ncbi:unnamed protein product, partial [Symbiodinium sp. CCMP2592]
KAPDESLVLAWQTGKPVKFDCIYNHQKWKAREIEIMPPTYPSTTSSRSAKLQLRVKPGFSVEQGLVEMTCFYMKKLLGLLGMKLPQPPTEIKLVEALAKHQLGDTYSVEKLQQILARRKKFDKDVLGLASTTSSARTVLEKFDDEFWSWEEWELEEEIFKARKQRRRAEEDMA